MRCLFALSMFLTGLWMTLLTPTASAQGNTCDFGEPDYAAYCQHDDGHIGYLGSTTVGVYGSTAFDTYGYLGGNNGAYGQHNNGNYGHLGGQSFGAYGGHNNGNQGHLASSGYGAYGFYFINGSGGNIGFLGSNNYGAWGEHVNDNIGFLGSMTFGVWGTHNTGTFGFLGSEDYGAYGAHTNGHAGRIGGSFYGVQGQNTNNNRGYLGHADYGLWATGSPWAGYFAGNVHVTGTLSGGSAASKVDHPLDPAGRYLSQSFIESPDMMNVYNGNVTTDAEGFATVTLPAYVEALNRDFRYQLTVIGTFAQAIVAEKIQGIRFVIRTDEPNVEVSWQVTGIRHDPWAEANRIVVEQAKLPEEQGRYLHPRLYGQPEALRIGLVEDNQASADQAVMQQQRDEERRRMQAEHERLQTERPQHPPPRDNQP